MHSCSSLEPIPDSRPQWAKSIPFFQTTAAQEPYPLGRHIPIWLQYKGLIPLGVKGTVSPLCTRASHLLVL